MTRQLAFDGFRGEAAEAFAVPDPVAEARRLLDPAAATQTLHWGRNYLYRARVGTAAGDCEVVVKQFREGSWRERLARRRRGSKAARSWRAAQALGAAGIATPEPLLFVESISPGGPSLFVSRFADGRTELRFLLRARNAGREREEFPEVDFDQLIDELASLARRLHEAKIWHRDFSIGNLLVAPAGAATGNRIAILDLNRCRIGSPVSPIARMREIARLPLEQPRDRRRLLAAYFADRGRIPRISIAAYEATRRSFHGRHRLKARLRGAWSSIHGWLVPRGTHAHIPPPPPAAAARDRIVWDRLSDQPHSHAGRWARARIRLADLGDHLESAAATLGALPRIVRAHRRLVAARNAEPFSWPGGGVALRPWPDDPDGLMAAFDGLGVRCALVRLHPWQATHDQEEELARELAGRGVELTFALPQSRDLVRDPARWRSAIEELAERFTPFGRRFQIGQAINRSKWGVWSYGEYLELAAVAAGILRRRPGVELAGPAVIDFEAHATAAVVNRRRDDLRFDALSSLLYVDRRGAPENRQLGFDTVDKVTLLAAIADSSRLVDGRRQWISEVNWPLAEGPHSPAGRKVAVDPRRQAEYLARFYLLALGTGYAERVYWWQLVARGYGLIDPGADGRLQQRPSYRSLAELARAIPPGSLCHGPEPAPAPARVYRFVRPDGGTVRAAWSVGGDCRVEIGGRAIELTGAVCYLEG